MSQNSGSSELLTIYCSPLIWTRTKRSSVNKRTMTPFSWTVDTQEAAELQWAGRQLVLIKPRMAYNCLHTFRPLLQKANTGPSTGMTRIPQHLPKVFPASQLSRKERYVSSVQAGKSSTTQLGSPSWCKQQTHFTVQQRFIRKSISTVNFLQSLHELVTPLPSSTAYP